MTRADDGRRSARPADLQIRRRRLRQAGERCVQCVDGVALRGRIEAGRARLHEQQGFTVRGKPDPVMQLRTVGRGPALRQRQGLERRIACQQRLEQIRAGRTQFGHALLQLVVQERRIERGVIERRRQQIAIRQKCRIECGQISLAVEHLREARIAVQLCRELMTRGGGSLGCCCRNGEQEQTRRRAVADLVEQQLLLGGCSPAA